MFIVHPTLYELKYCAVAGTNSLHSLPKVIIRSSRRRSETHNFLRSMQTDSQCTLRQYVFIEIDHHEEVPSWI